MHLQAAFLFAQEIGKFFALTLICKIGPFGELIKNGLRGRFPTLRKDDGDVKSSRPPPPSPPGPVGYVTVGGRFSAFSRLRIVLKSNQKHQ